MSSHKLTREDWENTPLRSMLVRHADPEKDRIFLNYFVYDRHYGAAVDAALKKLGGQMDEWFTADPDYWIEYGKVKDEDDIELLKRIAFSEPNRTGRFAFCRLTGYRYPAPDCDADSHRTYYCGRAEGMTPERVREFCAEMVEKSGPFAKEAEKCLKKPPLTIEEQNEKNWAEGKDYTIVGPSG